MLRVQQRPASGDSEADVDSAAREELAKFQRELRVKEARKKSYSDQAQNVLRKQAAMMRALTEEKVELRKDLSLAASSSNESKDEVVFRKFQDLIRKQSTYQKQIQDEEKLIASLNRRIRELEIQVDHQRKVMGGAHMSQLQHISLKKQLKVLENRLDKALVRHNTALATNAKMRDTINHLRQEKRLFEGLRKKLKKEQLDCKREMGEVIEQSTRAYDSRDDAQNKLVALKEKADKELAQYSMELKELTRVIDHDRRLRQFMARKDQERTEAHEEMEASRRRKIAEKTNEREQTVTSYEEAFHRIQEATGITDIDQLVSNFIEVEDLNFALFNYVNELSSSMELVQEQIGQVKQDMTQFQREGLALEEERQTILRSLEQMLEVAQKKVAAAEGRHARTTKVLEQLKSGVDSLFSKIGCDGKAITELLGGRAGVTGTTVLQYLGSIEQRTNELLQLQAFIQAKDSDDPDALAKFLTAKSSLPGLAQPSLLLPSTMSEYSIEDGMDDEGKPLTDKELQQRAALGVKQREARRIKTTQNAHSPPGTTPAGTVKSRGTTSEKKRSMTTR